MRSFLFSGCGRTLCTTLWEVLEDQGQVWVGLLKCQIYVKEVVCLLISAVLSLGRGLAHCPHWGGF